MRRAIFFVIALMWSGGVWSQNLIVKGLLLDSATRRPLIYASVQIKNNQLGTISNAEGLFYLKLPPTLGLDTLVFSFIGFESREIPVQALLQTDTLVYLKEKMFEIGEVYVQATGATEIVQRCIGTFDSLYYQDALMLKAYFRELITDNGRMEKFTEAQLAIAKQSYSGKKQDAMQFLEGKYHENQSLSPLWKYLDFINGPYEVLHCDVAKYSNNFILIPTASLSFLNPGHFKHYQYKILAENGAEYLIEFRPKSKRAVFKGQLIINKSDYALLAYYYTIDNAKLSRVSLIQFDTQQYLRELDIQSHSTDYYAYAIYRQFNGAYILHHAGLSYESLFHSTGKNFLSLIRVSNQLVITEYNNNEPTEIPFLKRISHQIPVYEQILRLNNPDFEGMQIIVPEQNIRRFLHSAAQ